MNINGYVVRITLFVIEFSPLQIESRHFLSCRYEKHPNAYGLVRSEQNKQFCGRYSLIEGLPKIQDLVRVCNDTYCFKDLRFILGNMVQDTLTHFFQYNDSDSNVSSSDVDTEDFETDSSDLSEEYI